MTLHIVLDFETLSLKDNAVLLALGAVAIDAQTGAIHSEFYSAIDPRQQPNRHLDPTTVLWWLKQDKAAQSKLTEAADKADQLAEIDDSYSDEEVDTLYAEAAHRIDHVAQAFVAWINHLPEFDGCWSNGAVDHGWLASMMEYSGLKNPIPYWKQRDYRTLKALFPAVKAAELDGAVKHHALWDAKYQAEHLVELLQHVAPANAAGSTGANRVTLLPDGSAFAVASYPLPQEHWLYAPREYADGADAPKELPRPILRHDEHREALTAALRYAVRGATNCGTEPDFDPDALVQNAIYALCGPYTGPALQPSTALSGEDADTLAAQLDGQTAEQQAAEQAHG